MPADETIQGFISYAHADAYDIDRLEVHLREIERHLPVRIWRDPNLHTGQTLNREIEEAIAKSRFFVLAVTPDFFASDYIFENELPAIAARVEEINGLNLIVVVKNCHWEPFVGRAGLVAAPLTKARQLLPARDWQNEDGFVAAGKQCFEAIARHFSLEPISVFKRRRQENRGPAFEPETKQDQLLLPNRTSPPSSKFDEQVVKEMILRGEPPSETWTRFILKLDLSRSGLTDTRPIAGLTHLKYLSLAWNPVADAGSIVGLTRLQHLYLNFTQVADVTPVANLTQLQTLDLHSTRVADLHPIAGLAKLEDLNLCDTEVADLGPVLGLKQLQILDLESTRISDLGPIAGLTRLRRLDLDLTPVVDLSPISRLAQLQRLDLESTRVVDLGPIAELTELQFIDLQSTRVVDLRPIANLTQLQHLDLRSTQVTDLSPIARLTKLQHLNLNSSQVADLRPIAELTQLEFLDFESTQVTDLSPIADLPRVESLNLRSTQVVDLGPLGRMISLRRISLDSIDRAHQALQVLPNVWSVTLLGDLVRRWRQ